MDSLPLRLRHATHTLHQQAESSALMVALLQGRLPWPGYRALLTELLVLYEALEAALASDAQAPWLAGLDLSALARAPGLRADLGGHRSPARQPTTTRYSARLEALGKAHDPALLAHVYTRYLGDLHGGQLMRRVVQRCYPGQGCAFHDFGDAATQKSLRQQISASLASAPLSAAESDRVVDEARWAFEQHQRLFDELAASSPRDHVL